MYKYLAVFSLWLFSFDAYAKSDCLKSLKGTDVKMILDTCFTFEEGKMDMALLFGTHFTHKFGSKDNPSPEAIYLKAQVDNEDPQAMFIWGQFVLGIAYDEISSLEMREESKYWVNKSADSGYSYAMYSIASAYAISTETTAKSEAEKERAIYFAKKLSEQNFLDAKELLNKINKTPSKEDFTLNVNSLYQEHKKLSEQQLLDLASVFSLGWYDNYRHKSLKLGLKNLKIEKDTDKSVFLLQQAMKMHNSSESSYQIGVILEKKNSSDTFKYYLWAAENKHPEAAAWVGDFYACTGEKEVGLSWLHKSETFGYEYADFSFGEIEELGEPTTCQPYWNSWPKQKLKI
ncbi:hypothetical protein L1077_21980 [Pseudoalteromonas luteoviolacea]|uniref:hypothetical protein n=1 Tax=Pseudoalteromonas luteoviolacea TaxID=43657 RepID=UPI001F425F4B|nr:hypothetical protein [Pseudoalteromonas luteoviolacea]MCF6442100.1 hypothetical protein [Pseudoalteromonas luteoviolacea]